MDNSSSSPTNIVATAMSSANLVSPESPQVSVASAVSEVTQRITMSGSSSPQHTRIQQSESRSDSMEVSEAPSSSRGVLHKQPSRDTDSPLLQRQMDTGSAVGSPYQSEDHESKTMVIHNEPRNAIERRNCLSSQLRNDGKEHHLVTITPPTSFQQSMNGDSRMAGLMLYAQPDARQDPMIGAGMNIHLMPNKNDSHTELEKPNEDTCYSITCGNNKADLVWKKFICPGINAKCVKCGELWFTPKEFVNHAGKSTLKDWKRAIRINGTMLRKLIENGELNYYDHENNCSNQCRSNKSSSFDSSNDKTYSFENDPREMGAPRENPYRVMSQQSGEGIPPNRSSSEDLPYHAPTSSKRPILHKSQESNTSLSITGSLERSSSEDSGLAPSPHVDTIIMRETVATAEKLQDLQNFWNGIIRSDLFDDIVRDVVSQITSLHSKTKHTNVVSVEDAATLTNLVNSLEMIPTILQKLSVYKQSMEKQAEESNQQILELEKKLAEQKKYEQDLKRKSQHLDSVMSLTPTEKRQKRAIMRFVRQKAVDTRIPPGVIPGTSTSPVPCARMNEVMLSGLAAQAAAGRGVSQRELWPQALQVMYEDAASSQMARMNVSGCGSSGIPAIGPMFLAHNANEAFTASSLSQAFMVTQQPHHAARENTQSPKK